MTLCYCTNIWNHHQGPVATELAKLLGDDFRLLLYQPLDHPYSANRIAMGWNLFPPKEPWIVGPPEACRGVDYAEQIKLAEDADVLIANNTVPYITQDLLRRRHKKGKLNFRMGERFFKIPLPWWSVFSLRKWAGRMLSHYRYESAHVHYLTMSHWCAEDLHYYHACKGRIWKWGYLTSVSEKCCEKHLRDKIHVGWCGRLIDWKRVDLLISAVGKLSDVAKRRCRVTIMGSGDQETTLRALARRLGLDDVITFRPPISSSEVADFMKDLDVYVFPSNRKEGWGAALLEAMDNGCAVIANAAAGSTLEVVQDGVNGLVFDDNDVSRLTSHLEFLIMNDESRRRMGVRAWEDIQRWSPANGAKCLVKLVAGLLSGNENEIPRTGICSKVG